MGLLTANWFPIAVGVLVVILVGLNIPGVKDKIKAIFSSAKAAADDSTDQIVAMFKDMDTKVKQSVPSRQGCLSLLVIVDAVVETLPNAEERQACRASLKQVGSVLVVEPTAAEVVAKT